MHHALPELAQAPRFRAVAHASGSGGGPQADPPRVTLPGPLPVTTLVFLPIVLLGVFTVLLPQVFFLL